MENLYQDICSPERPAKEGRRRRRSGRGSIPMSST